jgi:deoxyribose-phosphate aldolase
MDQTPPADRPASDRTLAGRLLPLLDLTNLDEDASPAAIEALCDAARTPHGDVAAVCVYPEHVTTARRRLGGAPVRVATVVNFPDGGEHVARAVRETRRALAAGADEVDLVLPYRALLRGDTAACAELVRGVRRACGGNRVLKLIIESGELQGAETIRRACAIGIDAGVDFLKTSTGKVPFNASPEAARSMLEFIRETDVGCGFKAAGGIRTLAEAGTYLGLAEAIMGRDWITPAHFRIGASSLLDALLEVLRQPP